MKQLSLAVASYRDEHKRFPPAFVADKQGRPMHSWRVLILPYLDQNELYKAYNFDEPWDGPNNRKLASRMPRFFCSSGDDRPGNTTTNYVAVVGPETIWPGATGASNDISMARAGRTILIAENQGAKIHWMEPRDLTFADMDFTINSPKGVSSKYHDPAVAMVDTVSFRLTKKVNPDTLRALLRIDSKEEVKWNEEEGWHILPDGRQRPPAKPQ